MMMFCLCPSKVAPDVTQVSPVRVMMIVLPPATTSASTMLAVAVPVTDAVTDETSSRTSPPPKRPPGGKLRPNLGMGYRPSRRVGLRWEGGIAVVKLLVDDHAP